MKQNIFILLMLGIIMPTQLYADNESPIVKNIDIQAQTEKTKPLKTVKTSPKKNSGFYYKDLSKISDNKGFFKIINKLSYLSYNLNNKKNIDDKSFDSLNEELKKLVYYSLKYDIEINKKFISKKINILDRKMAINLNYKNDIAIRRDKLLKRFLLSFEDIGYYIETINSIHDGFENRKKLNDLNKDAYLFINKTLELISFSEKKERDFGVLYTNLNNNNNDLVVVTNIYKYLVDYVSINQGLIKKQHWNDFLTMQSWIDLLNDNNISKAVNKRLNVFNIDIGGIILFLFIFMVVIVVYPVVFKFAHIYIERYIIKEELSDNVINTKEYTYTELRKPSKFLMVFIGIDLSTKALFYKTNFVQAIGEFSFVIYVIIFSWIFLRIINSVVSMQIETMKKKDDGMRKELFNLIIHTVKAFTFFIASILVLTHFGISITAILSTLGIGGLAFALAAKDTLSNLFGGVSIMIDNVFRLGDWVKIGESEGTVAEIGLRSTTIRTFDNALITIPNALISTTDVLNWNRRKVGRRIKMWVGVTYESDMANIKKSIEDIRDMLKNHDKISSPDNKFLSNERALRFYKDEDIHGVKNTQLVFLDRFNEYSIDIMIYCFSETVKWEEWLAVKEDVLYKIAEILNKNNVEFAYPTEVKIER